ncbi:cytidine deaminase [Nocardioides sp. GY 10127]|uniref:cytidine deaminase n=1 Tax=Nocardioides sp. GY 10127 TaxID=2569762 RepID=UPI0010A82600|nr:cytidine deaminase [Nocardioides sp. GY 10127]TIC83977.1 cytidine deaminase [Nocardioides sp. GY 10127]
MSERTRQEPPATLEAEDKKLVTLARATRARTQAAQGAAVRDSDGRTYAAATVALPSLAVSAVGVCVAMAVASGSAGLEAVVVLGGEDVAEADLAAVAEFAGAGVPVHHGDARGTLGATFLS